MSKTVYDAITASAKYDGSPTAHADVIATLKKHGHTVKTSSAWCSETAMAILYDAGCIDAVGGYSSNAPAIKSKAKKLGIWHSGPSGILPGDIVLYGSGEPNHTEFCIGHDLNVSGNYNGGCSRRKQTGRTINGYVRPKYAAMPVMDNLQAMLCACDVMLGVYSSGTARTKALSVFGAKNADLIQTEVTRVWNDAGKMPFDFAVYIISGRAGKDSYRKKRLGSFASSAQDKVNEIYALHTRSEEQAVRDVLADKYHTGAVRELLLTFNGYNASDIQKMVDKALSTSAKPPDSRFRIYPVCFFEKDESAYGDCTAIIEYDTSGAILHTVLIDTAMSKTSSVVISKLKAQGIKRIDAVIISHGHGDHYGGLTDIAKAIPIRSVYIPNCDGLDKYQKTYANALRRQAAKAPIGITMQVGKSYEVGGIKWTVLYQADASKLSEHDNHHFVNNMSPALRFDLGGILYHTAGDMQNEVNKLMIASVRDLNAHIFKCQWHGDGNATNEDISKAVSPRVAFFNYHHKESQGGRGTTRKRLEAVGTVVYRNHEDGDIFIDCRYPKITVTTSKSGRHDTYTV